MAVQSSFGPTATTAGADYKMQIVSELQTPLLRRMLALTMICAWLALGPQTSLNAGFLIVLTALLLGGFSLWLLSYHYRLGANCLLLGLTGLGLTATWYYPALPFPYFCSLVVAAAVFLAGRWIGLVITVGITAALWQMVHTAHLVLPPYTLAAATILLWLTLITVWLGMQPMQTLTDWSWLHYVEVRQQMAELREYQGKLAQALKTLDLAHTELARANRKLRLSTAIAEEARQAKAEFAATISHELRTPLNMITGFTEMILNAPSTYAKPGLPPALLADLNVVLRNAQHLSDLINDILDLGQLDVGRMALVREWADIGEIARSAVDAIAPLAQVRGLTIQAMTEQQLPPAFIDKTRIRQVILNLLSNAVRFTEQGLVSVTVHCKDGQIVVSVQDTGSGIADEDIPKLFEPFRQLDGSLGRRYGGSGLGLAISRSFIALHGGEMTVESQLGEGTAISLLLPIDSTFTPIPLQIHPDPEVARVKSARAEYVVVEPEPILMRLLHRYLTKDTVSAAPSVQAALKMSRTQVTRAIVVRTTHEQEARRLLTTAGQTPYDAPLIVCSMPGLPDLYSEEMGLAGYLLKPITRQQLLSTLAGFPHVKTILLVDDDADFRQLFVRMVQTAPKPYLVWQAMNAAEALRMIEQRRPDAIFLDVFLGDTDGPGLLQQIRSRPQFQKTPIFFITAKDASGSPLVASSLDVTHRGGLSADELLRCIQAIGEAFRGATPPVNRSRQQQPDPEPSTVVPG